MYPEYVLETLRKRWGLEADDTSKDEYFNSLPPKRVFDEVCEWNGLIHFGPCIRGWIEAIYAIDLDQCAEEAAKKQEFYEYIDTL